MSFSAKTRYLLVFLAILTGSLIELFRGYRWPIVIVGFFTFLSAGFLMTYLSGAKERALRRKQKRDYYAGLLLLCFGLAALPMHAQLLPEPAIPPKVKEGETAAAGRGMDVPILAAAGRWART